MQLESQVCALTQAKRLKELGIIQDSQFYYTGDYGLQHISAPASWGMEETIEDHVSANCGYPPYKIFSAFTVAELGVLLPPFFPSFVQEGANHSHCQNERVDTFPVLGGETPCDNTPAHILNKELVPMTTGKTEAEARANMLIFLLEERFIDPADCNHRLLKS